MIRPIASTGSPTEFNTIVRVTRPTLGTPAVPMEASVAVPITVRYSRSQWIPNASAMKYNSDTLHDGGTIHVDGCSKRNGE